MDSIKIREAAKRSKLIVLLYECIVTYRRYVHMEKDFHRRKRTFKYDTEKIRKLKNMYSGKRCFIVATGPSQNLHDLNLIKEEFTIGVNAAYKVYPDTEWRPDVYVTNDKLVQKIFPDLFENPQRYVAFFQPEESDSEREDKVVAPINWSNYYLMETKLNRLFPRLFPGVKISKDISKVLYTHKTVVIIAIQIAIYMGAKEIYLTGCDCDYMGKWAHSDIMDVDYDYLSNSLQDPTENALDMIRMYEGLAEILKKTDIKIYNATRGGKLEVFPRVDLDELMK